MDYNEMINKLLDDGMTLLNAIKAVEDYESDMIAISQAETDGEVLDAYYEAYSEVYR